MKTLSWLCFAVLLPAAFSCKKLESLPDVPSVEFRTFEVFDTTDILGNNTRGGRLTFYFEDGDGDVGMEQPSGDVVDTNNLVLTLYRKTNGVMIPAQPNDPLWPSSYRIPYMDRTGQNKILKGTIDVTFLYLFYKPTDTIMYDFYIKDRALNQSNVATTNEIILGKTGTY